MKKLKNNAFTLIELLAIIVLISIIVSIAVVSYTQYYENTKEKVYTNYEDAMKEAAMEYIMDNSFYITSGSNKMVLTLKYLVGEKDGTEQVNKPYIDYFKNPEDGNDRCLDGSYVEVEKMDSGSSSDGKIDHNVKYEYKVCLKCQKYKSKDCAAVEELGYCKAGTYSSTGKEPCISCPGGYYSGPRSTSCTPCSSGYYSSDGSASCSKCPAGSYSGPKATKCERP